MVQMCDLVFLSKSDLLHRTLMVIANLLTAIPTILLNSFILLSIWKTPQLRKPSHLLIANLAVADLMVGTFCQPVAVIRDVFILQGESFSAVCLAATIARVFGYWLASVSLFTLVVISIDRMLVIKLKTAYQTTVTTKKVTIVLLFWWIVGGVFSAFFFFIHGELQSLLIALSVGLTIFLTIITISYVIAVKELNEHTSQVTPNSTSDQTSNTSSYLDVSKFRRSLKTMFIVFSSIMLFYIPYFCTCTAFTLSFVMENVNEYHIFYRVLNASEIVVLANSTVNPLIYLWRMGDLREAVKVTIRRVLRWKTTGSDNQQA